MPPHRRLLNWFDRLPNATRSQALASVKTVDGWVKVCLLGQNIFQQINAYHTVYTTLRGFIYGLQLMLKLLPSRRSYCTHCHTLISLSLSFDIYILDHRLASLQEVIALGASSLMLAALLIDLFVFTSNKSAMLQSPHWIPGIGFFFFSFVAESTKMSILFWDGDAFKHECQQTLAGYHHTALPPDNYTRLLCDLKRDVAQISGSFGFFLQTLLIVAYVITARLYMARRTTLLGNQGQNMSLYNVNRSSIEIEHNTELPAAPPYRQVDPLNHGSNAANS
ncbi:hypothetical protein BX666DRAFT_1986924 [Dichotomocladium elegans]|nr:hypothetical protein BX666DRAFT_1986924 [Dichotomocladium elegans]